jgi:hypothetical protein
MTVIDEPTTIEAAHTTDRQPSYVNSADRYSLLGYDIALQSESPEVRNLFATTFGEFAVPKTDRARPDIVHQCRVYRWHDGFYVECNGGGQRVASWQEAYGWLEWSVTHAALGDVERGVSLHAASVAKHGQALLLVGPSGSGKSTLTLELLQRGFDYMSDEAAVLRGDSADVLPFPRAVVLKEQRPSTFSLTGHTYIAPAQLGYRIIRTPLPPVAVILLELRAGKTATLRPVARAEALPWLLEQVFAAGPAEIVFTALAVLLQRAVPLRLTMGDSRLAAEWLVAIADQLKRC